MAQFVYTMRRVGAVSLNARNNLTGPSLFDKLRANGPFVVSGSNHERLTGTLRHIASSKIGSSATKFADSTERIEGLRLHAARTPYGEARE